MFDVGFWEIVVIFMLGLLVLGPEKLPRIAAQLGRWVGRARRTATQLRYQLEREIDLSDRARNRYTPPPRSSQHIPPAGKQTNPGDHEEPGTSPPVSVAPEPPAAAPEPERDQPNDA
jgi:sec-independent protein translocase protein TatB